ncbi:MAG: glucosaminidase domain-containing protein [Campylobacterota bacterium]|nr:glucosaminidase domain-containing protein [Campylobacterota bacterium]
MNTQNRLMFSLLKSFILLIGIIFITGCSDEKVTMLKEDFLKTTVGSIENQKLKQEIKVVEVVKPKVVKQIPKVVKVKKKVPSISVQEKKQHFKDILVPIVTSVYNKLNNQYEDVKRDLNTSVNGEFILKLKKRYRAKTDEELLQALKPHPVSIALAQSAVESAWLTSRFTKQANNIFGVWSFKKDEPRIAASGLRGDKTIYLRKYKTLKHSVEHYYYNLAISKAYKDFRASRVLTNDPYLIVEHLLAYSEKGEVYTDMLKRVIEFNKFDKYDIK